MIKNTRRSLGLLLVAALMGGLIPPEAARAAAPVLINLGGEASGGRLPTGIIGSGTSSPYGSVAAMTMAPLTAAPLSAPGVGVSASLSAFAPAPAAVAVSAAPAAAAVTALAAAPALTAAVAPAAAAGPSNDAPNTPKAAAPAGARSWLSRAAGVFTRRAAPEQTSAPRSDDEAKTQADRDFDGAAEKASDGVEAPRGRLGRLSDGLARAAGRAQARYVAKRAVDHDTFGGPKAEPMTTSSRAAYGLKWGLNLIGISALMDFLVTPVLNHIAWPLFLSPEALGHFGRVELLTKFGPAQIQAALQHAPLPFLTYALPLSTFMEEFTYRFLGFGVLFGLLAAAKPAAGLIAKGLASIPDASGFRSKVQAVLLAVGGVISFYAFPIAALRSSFNFAAAHFAQWGVDPSLFAMNMVAGWVLARAAYKTRGLTAPFVAHMVFNLAMLGSAFLGISLGWPMAAGAYTVLIALAGVGALWYNWRSASKERAFNLKNAAGKAALVLALAAGAWNFAGTASGPAAMQTAAYRTYAGVAAQVAGATAKPAQDAKPVDAAKPVEVSAPAAAPAAKDTAAVESEQDMIARVKPSVVQIVVQMDGGYAIGSGVIVTPGGRIVTNAHVVGSKQVGQIVQVELVDGTKIPAKIIAVNHDRDQAFLQLPRMVNKETHAAMAWPFSTFASHAPREGDPVFAMGHPLGLPFTVTKGIVSGLGSRGNMYLQYLQTDASITHGNSGGPLYNAQGEVLGINTMGPENGGSIGFSITAPSVVRALVQYDKIGNINTAALGIITDLSSPMQPDQGVAVEYVRPGSAAAKAGIRPGDVIIGAGGEKIESEGGKKSVHDLSTVLAQAKPGDTLELTVMRGDATRAVKVKLDAKKTSEETSAAHGFDGEGEAP